MINSPKLLVKAALLSSCIISALSGVAIASSSDKDVTPGFNQKIPEEIMTPNRVETRIGELNFYDGIPTDETLTKVYDNLDFVRGIDVFLNFIPATSVEGIRLGFKSLGVEDSNEVLVFDNLMDSNPLFLTGNTDTVYAGAMLDLEKDGVTVVEIPAGAGPGTLNDAFFRFVVDMGAPGPDAKKGGMYVILPPDYQGDLKPTKNGMADRGSDTRATIMVGDKEQKVWIAQSKSYNNWLILRGFLKDGKPDHASNMWRTGLKIYPLADAKNPKKMEFTNGSGKYFNTVHANDYKFYEELWHVIQKEPVSFIDPELRGQAAAIGIEKGKPFEPDARMKAILKDAVAVGNATARSIAFKTRDKSAYMFEGKQWFTGFIGRDYRWLKDGGNGGRNMDARTLFFYLATVNTPAMALQVPGVGSNYAMTTGDSKGEILYGEKNYKVTLPADAPAKDFWSMVAYDPQTRSELQVPGGSKYPSKNNKRDELIYNDDGSVTLYFGPDAPKGLEANWTETTPGKAWFAMLRLYGPLQPWFDKVWQPSDFELVK
ncbi:DUF1254 domain-containing protein [Shewanella eurypsychrophilus]|uniref:DUF1254 domain-containing protein n=1 Tax=Shewanella eurypsychrophilus TaxID=2593656 RepID=A0ABX6VAQ0_9GAMM|nr:MULTISPECIES: DUF1254 domain-containing protein [Shewanella]QFU24237.1 DUF1214 domain-containing protein [Shewanella sp. YLB-09]QPG59442.1 DUF1254 domain-containing protein [Shewanella eurypsychrophilus]